LAVVATGVALAVFASFPHRLEYLAHVLAGLGLAGLGAALTDPGLPVGRRASGGRVRVASGAGLGAGAADRLGGRRVGGIVAGVVVLAVLAELSFAGPPEVLDVANTMTGTLLGLAAVAGSPPAAPSDRVDRANPAWVAGVGIALVVLGLVVRYPVQQTVKHWWWFGS
jgi:hypothetical protein